MLSGSKRTPSGSNPLEAPVASGAPVVDKEEMDAAELAAREKAQKEEEELEAFTESMAEGYIYNKGQTGEIIVPGLMAKRTLKGRKTRRLNKPYKHQRKAALLAAARRRFMIFHDAGLGKTMTALLVRCIMHIKDGGKPMQMLVTCPLAVRDCHWHDTILNTLKFHESQIFIPNIRRDIEEERVEVNKETKRKIKNLQTEKKELMRAYQKHQYVDAQKRKIEKEIKEIEKKIEELQPRKIDFCDVVIVTTGLVGSCFSS